MFEIASGIGRLATVVPPLRRRERPVGGATGLQESAKTWCDRARFIDTAGDLRWCAGGDLVCRAAFTKVCDSHSKRDGGGGARKGHRVRPQAGLGRLPTERRDFGKNQRVNAREANPLEVFEKHPDGLSAAASKHHVGRVLRRANFKLSKVRDAPPLAYASGYYHPCREQWQ
jgi:hypothetical protein